MAKGRKKDGVRCAICGSWFKKITTSHLRNCSPGMTLEKYRQTYVDRPVPPDVQVSAITQGEMFDKIADWLSTGTPLAEVAERVVERVLDHQGQKYQVVTAAVLSQRVSRLKRLLDAQAMVEDRLLEPTRVAGMSTQELFQLQRLLSNENQLTFEMLTDVIKREGGGDSADLPMFSAVIDQRTILVDQTELPLPKTPQERDDLRRRLDRLMDVLAPPAPPVIDVPSSAEPQSL